MNNALTLFTSALILFAGMAARAETKVFQIEGMHCGSCVKMVKSKICQLPGVEKCDVEVNKATLTGSHFDVEKVKTAIASTGEYSVKSVSDSGTAETADPAAKPAANPTKKTGK